MAEITARDQRRLIPITSSSSIQQLIHHNDDGGQNFFSYHHLAKHMGRNEKEAKIRCLAAVVVMIIG